jgi:hypothetical protein
VTDRLRALSDDDLGAALTSLGQRIAWPVAGDLPVAVSRAIGRGEGHVISWPGSPTRSRRRTVAILVAAVLALAAAAVAAKLVVDLGAVVIRTVPSLPTTTPTATVGAGSFGQPISLGEAGSIAGFHPLLPSTLGPPDAIWAERTATSFDSQRTTVIVLAWRPSDDQPGIPGSSWGAVLMEFRGEASIASKLLFEGHARLGTAFVDGHDAYVVTGEHELDLLIDGKIRRFTSTARAILWNDGTLTLRLETALPRGPALALARRISAP